MTQKPLASVLPEPRVLSLVPGLPTVQVLVSSWQPVAAR
jgi:hypothetical protein